MDWMRFAGQFDGFGLADDDLFHVFTPFLLKMECRRVGFPVSNHRPSAIQLHRVETESGVVEERHSRHEIPAGCLQDVHLLTIMFPCPSPLEGLNGYTIVHSIPVCLDCSVSASQAP
jgi:hypothetical protein